MVFVIVWKSMLQNTVVTCNASNIDSEDKTMLIKTPATAKVYVLNLLEF